MTVCRKGSVTPNTDGVLMTVCRKGGATPNTDGVLMTVCRKGGVTPNTDGVPITFCRKGGATPIVLLFLLQFAGQMVLHQYCCCSYDSLQDRWCYTKY